MLYTWVDVMVHQERRRDLLREAKQERFAQQGLARQNGHVHFYCRALTWLGCRLVAWGRHLQEQYGVAAPAPALRTTTPLR